MTNKRQTATITTNTDVSFVVFDEV